MTWEELVEKIKESEKENRVIQAISIPGIEFLSSGGMCLRGVGDGAYKVYDGYTPKQQYDVYMALRKKL